VSSALFLDPTTAADLERDLDRFAALPADWSEFGETRAGVLSRLELLFELLDCTGATTVGEALRRLAREKNQSAHGAN